MKHSFHLCPGAGIPHVVNMNTISINRWIREISNPLTEPIFHYMESATEQGLISSRWACLPRKLTNHVHEHQRFKGISKKPQPLNLEERIHQHWTLYHIWNSKSPPRAARWNLESYSTIGKLEVDPSSEPKPQSPLLEKL